MRAIEYDERTIGDTIDCLTGARSASPRTYSNGRVQVSLGRRECYSYGTHFPLFRFVPRSGRHPALFVVNGDRWNGNNSRTNNHQESARRLIGRTGIASIVIPFSALDGAGMDIDSIRPIDIRGDSQWDETIERRTLAELPIWRRTYSESVTYERDTLESVPQRYQRTWRDDGSGQYGYGDILPDADGKYRFSESVKRTTQPDADGIYRWTETRHRLGDSLFSAVRTIVETRAALPFEGETSSGRESVILNGSSGRSYCSSADSHANRHTAGPSAACIHCGETLTASVTVRRRSRYLSSFDYNEPAPLYFLCEVPRGSAPTVDGAIDSLAPRAVHSAILAGREVRRQGDIFFIDTPLSRADLQAAGATFGRLTQWTRGAKPRTGEVTFRAPNRARDKAVATREARFACKLWRELYRDVTGLATAHELESAHPHSGKGTRAKWAKIRDSHATDVRVAKRNLRRATLSTVRNNRYVTPGPYRGESVIDYRRRSHLAAVVSARQSLERRGPATDHAGHLHARHARDNYRARYGNNAANAWNRAKATAQERYRPETVESTARAIADREAVRRHLSIYGTAHSASEVARIGSAVYVRGTVSHAVTLESNRAGGPDHRPIVLTADHWYLAVRNTVPRQVRRARRRGNRTTSGETR